MDDSKAETSPDGAPSETSDSGVMPAPAEAGVAAGAVPVENTAGAGANPAGAEGRSLRGRWRGRSAWWWARRVVLALVLTPFVLTAVYWVVPPVSTLMVARFLTLQPVTRDWVSLDDISPALVRSVIVSEDARYCTHHGIDTVEMSKVLDAYAKGRETRGASTITMQVVKNLFLWPGRDVARKALEMPLALWLNLAMSKRRVLEIYLNIAEWGPDGEFGIEAGSRAAFGRPAKDLTRRQAALMTAVLPNPIGRNPARPSRYVSTRANEIAADAAQSGGLLDCIYPGG